MYFSIIIKRGKKKQFSEVWKKQENEKKTEDGAKGQTTLTEIRKETFTVACQNFLTTRVNHRASLEVSTKK